MLERLLVDNLVVIRHADLEFAPGLNVVTGETGAGKTILTQALGLVLGDRTEASLVGPSETEAYVEAVFALAGGELDDEAFDGLRDLVPEDEETIVLARRVGADGRGRALCGGRSTTRPALEQAGARLVGVVSQHEARTLVRPAVQRALLDAFLGPEQEPRLTAMSDAWRAYGAARRVREQAEQEAGDADRLVADLEDVATRVEALAPAAAELSDLRAERDRLRHASELLAAAGSAAAFLNPDDGDGAVTLAERADRALAPAEGYDPRLAQLAGELRDAAVRLDEAARGIAAYAASVEHDPARLDAVEDRVAALLDLERRHGSIDQALVDAAAARERLERLAGGDAELARLRAAESDAETAAVAAAGALTVARRTGAGPLARAIEQHLADLAMADARVEVRVGERDLGPGGADEVQILLAANPGVEAGSLGGAASGGELSRISLAVRAAALERSGRPTLVFDEVDAGIGGRTALAVADKLAELARTTQLVCVTHLAQIAARGDRHFRVVKEPGDPTQTRIEVLDADGVERELARMLGGEEESTEALELARSLRGRDTMR